MRERLAEASRAAHVRREHRDAVREERLIRAIERRSFLALWPAVEGQHDRPGALESGRDVKPAGELEAVMRSEALEARPHELGKVDARVRAARDLTAAHRPSRPPRCR